MNAFRTAKKAVEHGVLLSVVDLERIQAQATAQKYAVTDVERFAASRERILALQSSAQKMERLAKE